MSFIYLASPYSDPDPEVREERYLAALKAVSALIKERTWAYSPIVHNHYITKTNDFSTDFEFWKRYDFTMIAAAHRFMILKLPGWKESKGIAAEMKEALRLEYRIEVIDP